MLTNQNIGPECETIYTFTAKPLPHPCLDLHFCIIINKLFYESLVGCITLLLLYPAYGFASLVFHQTNPLILHPFSLQVKPLEVRQAAGLLLKNNLRTTFKNMDPANQQYIKLRLLPCLGSPDRHIRSTTGTIISAIVQLVGVIGWTELLTALLTCLDSTDLHQVEGAMDALSKV